MQRCTVPQHSWTQRSVRAVKTQTGHSLNRHSLLSIFFGEL